MFIKFQEWLRQTSLLQGESLPARRGDESVADTQNTLDGYAFIFWGRDNEMFFLQAYLI